uniref:Uncharacterized protein n=1 Tax=Lepeophtheirus salmonis TaxID=72036 RepID=A0A0K2TWC2_LEPSM
MKRRFLCSLTFFQATFPILQDSSRWHLFC